jgi:glycosyltransferase involved in cell wall biosynthesis
MSNIVRLIRRVDAPTGTGPGNGMYALQRALAQRAPAWLQIGGRWSPGEIPWFWSWLDLVPAALAAETGVPLVTGPNQLFANSRYPCQTAAERAVADAASCLLIFTESAWYRDLIQRHRGPANRAPIVIWPYPIEPRPGGPLAAEYDVLIYVKSGYRPALTTRLRRRWRRIAVLDYGQYRRDELIALARRARACVYCSIDDRGPLALAEILLCGCPAVGVPHGGPWIRDGQTGYQVPQLDPPAVSRAIEQCHALPREAVRAAAETQFDTRQTLHTVIESLDRLRRQPPVTCPL